jgi:hypothetical protein
LNRLETTVRLNTYRGLLNTFQEYVKTFQAEKPLVHMLHGKIVEVTQHLLEMFIKPEHIPDSIRKLKQIDVTDRSIQKADKHLDVGKFAYVDLNKARLDKTCEHWVHRFYNNLRAGYERAAKKILQMPIENKTKLSGYYRSLIHVL